MNAQRRPETDARLAAAFWARVDMSAGLFDCWPWMGPQNTHGYGNYLDGAHRVALGISLGRRLRGQVELACHSCDNPICCNPAHLFAGTHRDNMRDALAKGRLAHQKSATPVRALEHWHVRHERRWAGDDDRRAA